MQKRKESWVTFFDPKGFWSSKGKHPFEEQIQLIGFHRTKPQENCHSDNCDLVHALRMQSLVG